MNIVMVDLCYPYGRQRVYLNGSLMVAAARMSALGHTVQVIDLNIDEEDDEITQFTLKDADLIGVSAYGAPYIPAASAFVKKYSSAKRPVIVGGQAIEHILPAHFDMLFGYTNAIQIRNDADLAQALGCAEEDLPDPRLVSMTNGMATMSNEYYKHYFAAEMPLVLGQGCVYQCTFCAARKNQAETHTDVAVFEAGLTWMCELARGLGFHTLSFYASSLDLFQNPAEVATFLHAIARVAWKTGVHIRLRGLCCVKSFLRAHAAIRDFDHLVRDAGLWSLGFGVDGADTRVWKAQHKMHNDAAEVLQALDLCTTLGIRPEVLLVMGFPEDTLQTLWKNVLSAAHYVWRLRHVMLRPYLAKSFVPGNDGWRTDAARVRTVVERPELFYNLDFCALGSPLTHPRRWHRWASNAAYIAIIVLFTPLGRCDTPPLLPAGEDGWYGHVARWFNRRVPADK